VIVNLKAVSGVDLAHPSVEDRSAVGRAARTAAPRSRQSTLDLADDRDPIALLEAENAMRVPDLVPIRYGRMVRSPISFFRGAAAVMAQDLQRQPNAGLRVQLSGDAHLMNFGGFASPERNLVFDLNDFDETLPGPFEWDVKRLAASIEVAARERGFGRTDRSAAVLGTLREYREAMTRFAAMGDLDVWYARLDAQTLIDQLRNEHDTKLAKTLQRSILKAQSNDGRRALTTLTRNSRFVSEPPLIVPLAELGVDGAEEAIRAAYRSYRHSLAPELRSLLERFSYGDIARKVVGVGSVGTRCWVLLMFGRDESDPLFLQMKEADASVLEHLLGTSGHANHGQRVVDGQRLMQASSDIFLGWVHADLDGAPRDFYVRQLRDWKVSLEVETILPNGLVSYGTACGWTLARAHARSGDRIAIASYLGSGGNFDEAVATFAAAYADLNERDHAALRQAVDSGRVTALEGV
jgi:uncharacterized protein (DUF2252 family)